MIYENEDVVLTIIFKKDDETRGKKLCVKLFDFLKDTGVSGTTVWTGVDGFSKRADHMADWKELL